MTKREELLEAVGGSGGSIQNDNGGAVMSDQGLSRAMKACLVLEDALQLFVRKEMSAEDFDRCIAASDLITKNLSKEIQDIKKLAAQEGGA